MKIEEKIRKLIENDFSDALEQGDATVPETYSNEMVLLESGLDSLGFAILVTSLEDTLGYDPFTLMDEPVYPRTFGEFVDVYLQFSSHAPEDVTK